MNAPLYTIAELRELLANIRATEAELDAHYASRPSDPHALSAEQWEQRMAKRDDIHNRLDSERRLFVRVVGRMLDADTLTMRGRKS